MVCSRPPGGAVADDSVAQAAGRVRLPGTAPGDRSINLGTRFIAREYAQFAREEDFVHVLVARHRTQSNRIAERFVRTLKESAQSLHRAYARSYFSGGTSEYLHARCSKRLSIY